MTGVHALTGILAALYARKNGGKGGSVEVSLFETAVSILDYDHPEVGQLKAVAQPVRFGSADRKVILPPPTHGADSDEILGEIGISGDELAQLRAQNIVR